jgi:hypothetical protein
MIVKLTTGYKATKHEVTLEEAEIDAAIDRILAGQGKPDAPGATD